MLKRILAATAVATILTAAAGQAATADGDPRFIFRYRAGLVAANNGGSTPDDGGVEEPVDGKSPTVDIELGNGWHLYCPARAGATNAMLAGLIGRTFRFTVTEDLIYTEPDGSGPFGASISYWDAQLPDSTYGFDAFLDPESFACKDEWGGVALLPGWTKPDRDSAVSRGWFESAVVSSGVSMRAAFPIRPPH